MDEGAGLPDSLGGDSCRRGKGFVGEGGAGEIG